MSEVPFPSDFTDQDEALSRRGFVRIAIGGITLAYAGAIGYPIYRYLNSPVETAQAAAAVREVTLEKADELPPGSAMIFKFGVRPAILVHHADGSWSALSAVCTHMGCTVHYEAKESLIKCECHGGVFDPKTGENIAGPPPRPLERYELEVAPGQVTVRRT